MSTGGAAANIWNDALDPLETLIGQWSIELSNADFSTDAAPLSGRMSVTWLDGRALLVLRSVIANGPPASVQVVGRNETRDDFTVLYSDERGVSRVYTMTFADGRWTQFRSDPGFHQKMAGRVTQGGNRIEASWSKSHDGVSWQHDFGLVYVKLPTS